MKRVVLESPYSSQTSSGLLRNLTYARACLADCLRLGESPLASHLLLTQPGVLDDQIAEERAKGILAGHAWIPLADSLVVYTDLGISGGMDQGIDKARDWQIPIEYRTLPAGWETCIALD